MRVANTLAARLRRFQLFAAIEQRDGHVSPRSLAEAAGITYRAATSWLCMTEFRGEIMRPRRAKHVLTQSGRLAMGALEGGIRAKEAA